MARDAKTGEEVVTIRMSPALHGLIAAEAQELHMPVASVMRTALLNYVRERLNTVETAHG